MNIVDKNLLLNKIKDMSVQNNILNKIKSDTIKQPYIMDSIIESPSQSQSNVHTLIQSLQVPRVLQISRIPDVQDVPQDIPQDVPQDIPQNIPQDIPQNIPQVPQISQVPEAILLNTSNTFPSEISETSNIITETFPFEIIESTDINPFIEAIEYINEPIDIIAIIESIKEPIALLEKYMLTNHVPSNINPNDIKNYINIYKTIIAVKENEDIIKISKYAKKSGCFGYIKKIFFK